MPRKSKDITIGGKVFVLPKPSQKTKTRINGVKSLSQMIAEKNPVAHALLTTKDASEALYKIRYGRNLKYRRLMKTVNR